MRKHLPDALHFPNGVGELVGKDLKLIPGSYWSQILSVLQEGQNLGLGMDLALGLFIG